MSDQTRKKEKVQKLLEKGEVGLLELMDDIEDKIELFKKEMAKEIDMLKDAIKKELPEDVRIERMVMKIAAKLVDIQVGPKGDRGDPFIPTEDELRQIAAKVKIPIIEKVIEKTEVVKEVPTITNQIIETIDESKILSKLENNLPQLGERIRDGLEVLQGDDRLDKSAIKGLDEVIKRIDSKMTSIGGSRRVFQPHIDRFTSQTNGVTKTFYLTREPLKTNTIEVSGTDFPIILDPNVDFTVTGKTLTLSSNIPAPSQGATLIVKYYA